jgi:hypothetical protein
MSKFIDEVDQLLQAPTKWTALFSNLFPGTFGQRLQSLLALAALDQSPLLKIVLVGIALWMAYLAMQNGPRYRD